MKSAYEILQFMVKWGIRNDLPQNKVQNYFEPPDFLVQISTSGACVSNELDIC